MSRRRALRRLALLLCAGPWLWPLHSRAAEPEGAPGDGLDRVIDAAIGDWNKDGRPDLALLIAPPSPTTSVMAELRVYIRQAPSGSFLAPAQTLTHSVWGYWPDASGRGREPSLRVVGGALAIVERNTSTGRYRFQRQRTLAWREGALAIVGLSDVTHDTLSQTRILCDLNLLTGRGYLNGKPVRIAARTITLAAAHEGLTCTDLIQP